MFTSFALPWAAENMNAIEKLFRSEFDYLLELSNMQAIRANLLPRWGQSVKVPKAYPDLSTQRVLCMELLDGEKVVDAVQRRMRILAEHEGRSPEAYEKEQLEAFRTGKGVTDSLWLARWKTRAWRCWRWLRWGDAHEVVDLPHIIDTMMAVHGEQVFLDGVFNADPHPGNILLLRDGRTLGLIDFGQVKELPLDFRIRLAKLVIALAQQDEAKVAQMERDLGMRTRHSRDDVRYRVCSFWLDRDTDDIMQGMNLHDFMAWGESEDPVLEFPEELYLVYRCSVMIRSLALAFGIRLSTAQHWRPHAEELLRRQGLLSGAKS
ncbi:unnamed protein product [Polarella glacialis]|nr:unnamed protein product [Polarella glacialis]